MYHRRASWSDTCLCVLGRSVAIIALDIHPLDSRNGGWNQVGIHPLNRPCPHFISRLFSFLRALSSPAYPSLKHLRLNLDDPFWLSSASGTDGRFYKFHFPDLKSLQLDMYMPRASEMIRNCDKVQYLHVSTSTLYQMEEEQFGNIKRLWVSDQDFDGSYLANLSHHFPNLRELGIEGLEYRGSKVCQGITARMSPSCMTCSFLAYPTFDHSSLSLKL